MVNLKLVVEKKRVLLDWREIGKRRRITRINKTVIFPQIDRYVYSISQIQSQNLVPIWYK